MQKVIDDNRLENPERLVVGQTIVVMTENINHTVAPGESLYSIARRYRTTVSDILRANPEIAEPSRIRVGQVVVIPVASPKL